VFFITAGVYAVGGIIFCILVSGTIQPWAIDKTESTTNSEIMAENSLDTHIGPLYLYRPKTSNCREIYC